MVKVGETVRVYALVANGQLDLGKQVVLSLDNNEFVGERVRTETREKANTTRAARKRNKKEELFEEVEVGKETLHISLDKVHFWRIEDDE